MEKYCQAIVHVWHGWPRFAHICTRLAAALLLWVEISVKIHFSKTVTDQKAYWVTPSNNTSLQPQELINIDFRSPQLKRRCIETALITSPTNHLHEKKPSPAKENWEEDKWNWVEHILKQSEEKLAIHRILPGFTDKFKPDAIQYENKLLKTKLYSEELVNLSFEDLPIKCNNIYETITITQKYIVDQKNSYLYYKEDGNIFLKGNHSYFYQVQTQMLVTGLQFCDLFLWTNCDVYR